MTLSHVDADTSKPLRDTTVASILADAAAASPDREALVEGAASGRRRWTYAELFEAASSAAGALAQRFDAGERVAVYAPSLPEVLVLSFGAAMAGLVFVPLNPVLRAREVEHILATSGAAGAFVVESYRGNALRGTVEGLRGSLPVLREVVGFEDWAAFTASGPPEPGRRGPGPDDVAQIVFTSGTTGKPKGARLTHRGMTNASRFGAERFGLRPGDRYLQNMPLFHVGGQEVSFGICQRQAANINVPVFEPGLALQLVEEEGVTHAVGVPTMLVGMIEHAEFSSRDLSSLRSISSGGAVVPPELISHIESHLDAQVTVVFGQTESCGYISQTELDDAPEDKALTLGHALEQLEVRVVDPATLSVVPCGTVGELQVRGYNVMQGYHDMPDATAETVLEGGWLRTGDLVTMDERGYMRIAGRLKEMIVSGGMNVYPLEIEGVLGEHPGVAQAAVLGVPDHHWGELVVGVLRARSDDLDVGAVEAWARERLAPYKIPKRWVIVEELPMTATGKVQKFVLREAIDGG